MIREQFGAEGMATFWKTMEAITRRENPQASDKDIRESIGAVRNLLATYYPG